MIAGSFGCTVRGMRIVFGLLREETGIAEGAVNFVGAYMVEAKAVEGVERVEPNSFGFIKQVNGTDHICVNEIKWGVNGTIDMTFSREVDHAVGLILIEYPFQLCCIKNIHLLENIVRQLIDIAQVLQIARIGQGIQIHDSIFGVLSDEQTNDVRADEAGAARYYDCAVK